MIQAFSHNMAAFIFVIAVLVFIHEFGHYYVALKNGVKVEVFAIGFGPELKGWNDKRGTRWKICLIPLGGYVKMYGDTDPASTGVDKAAVAQMTPEQRNQAFFAKSVGVRAAIVAAGPLVNFAFCILALFALNITMGKPIVPPVVGGIVEDGAAAQSGLRIGDKIISIDGEAIESFTDISKHFALTLGEPAALVFERAGTVMNVTITPKVEEVTNRFGMKHTTGRIGISSSNMPEYRSMSLLESLTDSFSTTGSMITGTFKGLGQIIMGERSSKELGGVITIAKLSGDTSSASLGSFIFFMAMLSANLGLVNLLPIPVLDGGHLFFYACEKLRGKPLPDVAQEYMLRFGLSLILTMTVFALWNDLSNFGVFAFVASWF